MVRLGEGSFTYEVSGENWGKLPDGWVYKEAADVAVDSKDRVYVYNRGTSPMVVYDTDGNVLTSWGADIFKNPHGVTAGPDDSIYCVDNGDSTVRKMTPEGEVLMTLGTPGQPAPKMSGRPFSAPTQVAIDNRNGDIYVADGYSNARVHKYDADGKHILSWGESGTSEGQFNIVHNLDTDSEGWVYVADRENHRIQVFSSDGVFEAQWVNLSRSAAVHLSSAGQDSEVAYVGEYFGGIGSNDTGTDIGPRLTIHDKNGNVLARLSHETFGDQAGRFWAPHGIATDSQGDIYVAEVSWAEFGRNLDPPQELRSMQKLVRIG